jgi:enolase-phosphatase E1
VTSDVLCDIEGTIGSIAFVRDTLFSYAHAQLPAFLREHSQRPEVAKQLAQVGQARGLAPDDLEGITRVLLDWIEHDRKDTALKTLQGMVWEHGYAAGDFRSHVFPDAHRQLQRWRERGLRLHIYSSGSVQAQKLYFRYSDCGDLRPLFSGWFDTTSGPKKRSDSYASIARQLDVPATQILFLSDVADELDAAVSAGMQATCILRPGEGGPDPMTVHTRHTVAESFDEVRP